MLEKVKQFFRRRSAKTEPSDDILPRNRFADLDFERILKSELVALLMRKDAMLRMGKSQNLNFLKILRNLNF